MYVWMDGCMALNLQVVVVVVVEVDFRRKHTQTYLGGKRHH
jgi:hypothetical protein